MENITTLLFDLDGTLLDSREFIFQATEHAMGACGYDIPDREIIRKVVGEAFPRYYQSLAGLDTDADRLAALHHEFQHTHYHLVQPFPGAKETLQNLKEKGYKLAVVTSRSNRNSHKILKDAGIYGMFDVIISLEDAHEPKPSPLPILKALEALGERPEQAVMVGDSHFDIESGISAGTKTVRVTYGFHTDNLNDPKPDYIINSLGDLAGLL